MGFVRPDAESAARALTSADAPRPTFPLILVSVTVAVLAMHLDAVGKYSVDAFWLGVTATALLAWGVGGAVSALRGWKRTLAAVALPTIGGAFVGMLVQGFVLEAVQSERLDPVRDLGGLVDTTSPVLWIAGGVVLGAAPALVVSVFLLLAARVLRRLVGSDAGEGFGVIFVGASGVFASLGLVLVEAWEATPLALAACASLLALVVALLVDGARLRFLRQAWRGGDGAFEVMPAAAFAGDPSLAPIVGAAGAGNVLVRVDRRPEYRGAAATPIALLGDSEELTTEPLRRRRAAAAALVVMVTALAGLAAVAHI